MKMKREARVIGFTLNGEKHSVDADEADSLLWIIREKIGLTGTKFGCGVAQCGVCTVHVDGAAVRSCVTTLGQVEGRSVTTIEGLSKDGPHALQKAWIAEQAPQCGYCQSGQIMSAAALLADRPKPSRQQIIEHMNGNICRCGTYHRIIAAIERVAKEG
jgi:isoquinoline 1-oxidoreductase alpha subunit